MSEHPTLKERIAEMDGYLNGYDQTHEADQHHAYIVGFADAVRQLTGTPTGSEQLVSEDGGDTFVRASSLAPVAPDLQRTARLIYDTFVKSEVAGYRSRDRRFAIELLGQALGLPLHAPADVAARDRVAPPSGAQKE